MGSISLYFFVLLIHFLCLLFCFNFTKLVLAHSSSSSSFLQQLCHNDESSALLQFKQTFLINKYASDSDCSFAYPKVSSWNPEGENGNCCSWDGVECDNHTGHVIGLDLSCSFLYGSINSNSTLFRLVHLQSLNLAFNDFNYSQIPSGIRNLSKLKSLNLSGSSFLGQIPSELIELANLAFLDLSSNSLLKLEKPSLSNLVENLTNLQELILSQVNISSTVPDTIVNLSSLSTLYLRECGLFGKFPSGIFLLPNLRFLSVRFNSNLTGYLPEFHRGSRLESLKLAGTNFTGKLPDSIGNLDHVNWLDIHDCSFSGSIPFSIGNLIKLTFVDLSHNYLYGVIPPSLQNMTQLTGLGLNGNQLTGEFPSWLLNLTQLTDLRLGYNRLAGTMEIEMFFMLKSLTTLILGGNKFSMLSTGSINGTLPKFKILGLTRCNLRDFPKFLQYQDQMESLQLDQNNIHGLIPKWIWNIGKKTLTFLTLKENFLTGFEQPRLLLPWNSLMYLELSGNLLQGSLPIPPFTTVFYSISDNSLTGEIPQLICKLSSLYVLDLSDNNLNGTIPQCLSNFSDSLTVILLRNNSFHGTIPQPYSERSNLKLIDLSQNHLDGPLPTTLANCKMLEILNLGNNQLDDAFPFWLGTIPQMKILLLRYNKFHGTIEGPLTNFDFPKLRIIDISWNSFSGELPVKYFQIWSDMKVQENIGNSKYATTRVEQQIGNLYWIQIYSYSMRITNKGAEMFYDKIQSIFKAIDLSGNKFKGKIPESIGVLKGLQLLNLSNNALAGPMPTSLGNLTALESLDLSQNDLSGDIPQQLVQLTFLAIFNVSHNHLTGPIPQGNQFGTFENSSFDGNSELCGEPLSKKCGNLVGVPSPTSTFKDEDSDFPNKLDWIIRSLGYLSGTVVGVVVGNILTTRYHLWFVRKFGKQPKWKRARKGGRRN